VWLRQIGKIAAGFPPHIAQLFDLERIVAATPMFDSLKIIELGVDVNRR